ncbi:MAG: hypothetical protein IIY30_08685, partial [Erysipelotrichaceae bacterium]|nr:hypothetical protein [Erysipelotrichaceae bacterium]
MVTNNEIQKYMSSMTDKEKEEFLDFLKERADAGKSAEEALSEYAALKGYNVTKDQLGRMTGVTAMSTEDLKE